MPPASVNTVSRASQAAAVAPAYQIDVNPNSLNLRDFVVDEDAANLPSTFWNSIDPAAYVLSQREALEAFNMAKAIRLSQETAASEERQRLVGAVHSSASASARSPSSSSSASTSSSSSTSATVLEHKSGPSSSASEFAKQKSSSSHRERKQSVSASAYAAAQQFSHPHLLLSTQSSSSVDNTSRASNAITSASDSQSNGALSHRIEQRSLSKKELESPVTNLSISMTPSSSATTSASASTSSSTRTQTSDHNNSKRQRTERQLATSPNTPSATRQYSLSQQQQLQQLAAPANVASHRSVAPRDTRQVQPTNIAEPTSTPVEPRSHRRSAATSNHARKATRATAEPRDTFTITRGCTRCGTPIQSPRSQPSTETFELTLLLHLTCTKCQTTHCRGCFAPVRCNRALVVASTPSSSRSSPPSASSSMCDGGSNCTIRTCCSAVRAIAIFEALSWFDDTYATEAGFGSGTKSDDKVKRKEKEQRDAYVRALISKTDVSASRAERVGSTRRFEDTFVRTLRLVCAWLQVPDRDEDDADEGDKVNNVMHSSIPRLFMSSMLLEVVHVFLSNTNVRDWIAHAETYLAVMELLRRMLDVSSSTRSSSFVALTTSVWADSITLSTILQQPMRRIDSSSGLRRAVWGEGTVRYESLSASTKTTGENARLSLCDLVKLLEAHRSPLMALAARITFPATVEKVNNLCDSISYLLLQQVVD